MGFAQRLEEVRTGFERSFWVANISELFERLSYYAAFASLARYLHETLSFPTERAADLSGLFGGLVWFLAIFGGAIADRLGLSCSSSPFRGCEVESPMLPCNLFHGMRPVCSNAAFRPALLPKKP